MGPILGAGTRAVLHEGPMAAQEVEIPHQPDRPGVPPQDQLPAGRHSDRLQRLQQRGRLKETVGRLLVLVTHGTSSSSAAAAVVAAPLRPSSLYSSFFSSIAL